MNQLTQEINDLYQSKVTNLWEQLMEDESQLANQIEVNKNLSRHLLQIMLDPLTCLICQIQEIS